MAYPKTRHYQRNNSYDPLTRVSITWQQSLGVYAFKMHKPPSNINNGYFPRQHWLTFEDLIKPIFLSMPHGSDREYDPETETWYFSEKYFDSIKSVIESFSNYFVLDILEKPAPNTNNGFGGVRVPELSRMKDLFMSLTGSNPDQLDFKDAKKAFFKASMKYHPDKNNGDGTNMYMLNEAWQELEYQLYKTKERVTELKELTEQTYG